MIDLPRLTLWQRFWHAPVRAERLAVTRILLGLAALTDQLVNFLPWLPFFYGPAGNAPTGLYDAWLLSVWRWTILLFGTDNLTVVWILFWLRFAVTVGVIVGWQTRWLMVLLYLLTLLFVNRNPMLRTNSEDALLVALFLLMFGQCGKVFSLDCWRRTGAFSGPAEPQFTPAWPVRLLQIQLCVIYLTTGLAKLARSDPAFTGTWWEGTSIHYVLNDITISHWSFAQLPLPLWVTAPLTYLSVGWEILFTPLVLFRRTRWLALGMGVLFHLGIWFHLEVGWFTFYFLAFYGVWLPNTWCTRLNGKKNEILDKSLE